MAEPTLTRPHPTEDEDRSPGRRIGPAEIRLGGDGPGKALLGPTLTWATARMDVVFSACAILSGRAEPISWAWGWVGAEAGTERSRLEATLRLEILRPARIAALAEEVEGDATLPTVLAPSRGDLDPGLVLLLERLGLLVPLVLVLRSQGRVAGLLWVCRAASSSGRTPEDRGALRRIHPLVEVALDAEGAGSRAGAGGRWPELTPRELSITELAVSGARNEEIAAALGIAETTVRNHMSRILRKFRVRSRAQLIAVCADPGNTWPYGRVSFR